MGVSISYTLNEECLEKLREQGLPGTAIDKLKKIVGNRKLGEKRRKGTSGGKFASGTKFKSKKDFNSTLLENGLSEYKQMILTAAIPAITYTFKPFDDFTLYFPRGQRNDVVEEVLNYFQPSPAKRDSYECKVWLWNNRTYTSGTGRVLACSCYEGKYWSLTFRKDKYYRDKSSSSRKGESKSSYLNEINDIVELLADLVLQKEGEEHGLIVIAGRTSSGKSSIMRGLRDEYLKKASGPRNHHLLTFEDPVEEYFYNNPRAAQAEKIDYTPRQKGIDVTDLRQATSDALRQTPKLMMVGETRNLEEWKDLLRFAGTGHLVITTTHAGSVTEAMGTILQATESKDHGGRSIVADRLLALIHLQAEGFPIADQEKLTVLYPTIWRHTPGGAKALMAEGLSSILPNTPKQLPPKEIHSDRKNLISGLPSSIGRYWFAKELINEGAALGLENDIKKKAMELDLEGM